MLMVEVLLGVYGFWALFVLVMGLYRAWLAGKLPRTRPAFYLALPWVAVGFAADVMGNYTLACIVFFDAPQEQLVTQRLKRYIASEPTSWRGRAATFICQELLNPFDPSGQHC